MVQRDGHLSNVARDSISVFPARPRAEAPISKLDQSEGQGSGRNEDILKKEKWYFYLPRGAVHEKKCGCRDEAAGRSEARKEKKKGKESVPKISNVRLPLATAAPIPAAAKRAFFSRK